MPRVKEGSTEAEQNAGDGTAKLGESKEQAEGDSAVNPGTDQEEVIAALGMTASQAERVIHPEKVPPLGPETSPPDAKEFISTLGKDEPVEKFIEKLNEPMDTVQNTVFAGPALPKHESFADIDDPDVLFLINEWGVTENERIIVRTHVESFTIRNTIKRAEYNDQLEYEMVFSPVNLPCNFIVDHVPEKIAETGSDLRLVSEVIRRASREMDLTIMAVIQERLDDKQRGAREKASRVIEGGTPISKPPEQEEL